MTGAVRAGLGLALVSAATFGTSGTFADLAARRRLEPGRRRDRAHRDRRAAADRAGAARAARAVAARSRRGRRLDRCVTASSPSRCCQFFFFNAVEHLSVGVALLLEYLGILLVVALDVAAARAAPAPAHRHRRRGSPWSGWCSCSTSTGRQHVDLVGVLVGPAAPPSGWPSTSCCRRAATIACRRIALAWAGDGRRRGDA